MLFNSLAFAVFLPIVFALYWALPGRYRWVLTLAASYYFYMSWNAKYVFLILFTTACSYCAALLLEKQADQKVKKWILAATAAACLGVLFFFKYFNFVSDSAAAFLSLFSIRLNPLTLKLLLPVGISFYTFQTLSYVIDVYRGDVAAEHHFGYYAAFISFFPQLVAGPIERTSNLLPQIRREQKFCYDQASYGAKLMAWGYFKKVVIADTLSGYVSRIYDAPEQFRGFALVLATLFFTIQIYCDFSGYSDIAIGVAKLLGIDLMTNFKSPYFSRSVKEFWSRWHISLSTWFRDYVYIPLGGNRVGKLRHRCNLLITFLVSGLWHGASWTFVVWGGIHGAAQVIENALLPKGRRQSTAVSHVLQTAATFVFCALAWVFFVSHSLQDACYVLMHMLSGITSPVSYILGGIAAMGMKKPDMVCIAVSVLMLAVYDWVSVKRDVIAAVSARKKAVRWLIYCALGMWILLNLPVSNAAEFIYFQF